MPTVNIKLDFNVSTTTDRINYGKFEIAHRAEYKVERKILSLEPNQSIDITANDEFKFICVFVMTSDTKIVFNILDKDGGFITSKGKTIVLDTDSIYQVTIVNDNNSIIEVVVLSIE